MKLKLIDDARQAQKLWSLRLAIASALFSAAEAALPMWLDILPQGAYAAVATLLALGAGVARVIRQEKLHAK